MWSAKYPREVKEDNDQEEMFGISSSLSGNPWESRLERMKEPEIGPKTQVNHSREKWWWGDGELEASGGIWEDLP